MPLDLQFIFRRAYDSGPYQRGLVDYDSPPQPPLRGEAATWAADQLRRAGVMPRTSDAPGGNPR